MDECQEYLSQSSAVYCTLLYSTVVMLWGSYDSRQAAIYGCFDGCASCMNTAEVQVTNHCLSLIYYIVSESGPYFAKSVNHGDA